MHMFYTEIYLDLQAFRSPKQFWHLDLVRCWGVPGTARYMTPTSYLELIKLFTDLLGTQLVPSWVRFATVFEWNFGNGGQWDWWWSVLHIFLTFGDVECWWYRQRSFPWSIWFLDFDRFQISFVKSRFFWEKKKLLGTSKVSLAESKDR